MFKKINITSILLGLLLIGLVFFLKDTEVGAVGGALCAVQFNEQQYRSNDPFFNSPVFHFVATANNCAQGFFGEIKPDDFVGEFLPKEKVKIDAKLDQSCRYYLSDSTYESRTLGNTNTIYRTGETSSCFRDVPVCRALEGSISDRGNFIGCRDLGQGDRTASDAGICQGINLYRAGEVYEFDATPVNHVELNVTATIGNIQKSIILTPTNQEGVIDDFIRIGLRGNLQGFLSCPDASQQIVAYREKNNPNELKIRQKSIFNQIKQTIMSLELGSNLNFFNNYPTLNNLIGVFGRTEGRISNLCEIKNVTQNTLLTSTYLECTPITPVAIPVIEGYIRKDRIESVQITIPEGNPEIISIQAQDALAAQLTPIIVKIKNTGETDAFDVEIRCKNDISPFSKREIIESGTEKDVTIEYQGSGFKKNCMIQVKSVNNPNRISNVTQKILAYPFMSAPRPSDNHRMVFTEIGPQWICPNQYVEDVNYADCQPLKKDYDRCTRSANGTCIERINYFQLGHCINSQGEYAILNDYMDDISYTKDFSKIFIPENKPYQNFIITPTMQPSCRYYADFGYDIINGQAVEIEEIEEFGYENAESGEKRDVEINIMETPQNEIAYESPEIMPVAPKKEETDLIGYFLIGGLGILTIFYILRVYKVV